MKYNPKNIFEVKNAELYFEKLKNGVKPFEVSECRPSRTNQQNRTIHMWFAVLADHIGYNSLEECKRDVLREIIGLDERMNRLTDKMEPVDFHTHQMDIKTLSVVMDKLKRWAQIEQNCYLPYYGDAGYNEMVDAYKNQ